MKKHNKRHTPEYRIWTGMKNRCHNPNDKCYARYARAGIKVCSHWFDSFQNFFDDMGKRPEGMTITRKDSTKGYSPDNCKWATQLEQQNNRKDNVRVELNGKNQTISQWCRELGANEKTIRNRLHLGWEAKTALTTPVLKKWSRTRRVITAARKDSDRAPIESPGADPKPASEADPTSI